MRYVVSSNFAKINETSGTIQNVSKINVVEISDSTEANSGIMLYPMDKHSFNTQIYARCIDSGGAELRVVPFEVSSEGGGIFDFSLDQLGTTFINNFAFSGLSYPNATDPQLDGKPVLVMSVKGNNDKSKDIKYVFVNLESLMVHYDDFAGAGVSAAGMSGMVPAPSVGDYDKFLCGNGTWETINTGLDAISLALGNVPTFKIRSGNGVEFAADLYPATDTLVGDTLYFDKHIFQFAGLSSGLTLHDSNFYAASDSAFDNSFGSIVAAPNNYTFCFGSENAFAVGDSGVISVAQLDSKPVNLSLDLEKLNIAGDEGWGWLYNQQANGKYYYKSSNAAIKYINNGSASYTYDANATEPAQKVFTIKLAKDLGTDIITAVDEIEGNKPKARFLNKYYSPSKFSEIAKHVKVEEIRDSSGTLTKLKVTILDDTAIKDGNVWIDEVSAVEELYNSIPADIVFADGVATNYMYKREDGTLVEEGTSGNYTFTTDNLFEGYEKAESSDGIRYEKKTIPTDKADQDQCTITGLASGLKIYRTGEYIYDIYTGDTYDETNKSNVVGEIYKGEIRIKSKNALAANCETDGFQIVVSDTEYNTDKTGDGNITYQLYLLGDDFQTSGTTTNATFVKGDDGAYTYKIGNTTAYWNLVKPNAVNGQRTTTATYVGEHPFGETTIDGKLTLNGLSNFGVSVAELTVDGSYNYIYKDRTFYTAEDTLPTGKRIGDVKDEGIVLGEVYTNTKTIYLSAELLPENPDSDITITLGGDNDYTLGIYNSVWYKATPYRVYKAGYYDAFWETGYQSSSPNKYGWDVSDDGKSVIRVATCGIGEIRAGRPIDWLVRMNDSDEVYWSPEIYMTSQEYSVLSPEERNKYTHISNDLYCYNLNSASAIKVADFDGETITINHNVLDNRSLSSPLALEFHWNVNVYGVETLGNLKLDLATDNETAAISRNFAYETFTAGASAGTYTYAALSSTEGWDVSADEHQIISVELEGKTFTLNNLRTDLGNLGFDSQGYIHATNGSTIGRMRGTGIKLFDTAVHKLATPTITGTDAAGFTLILPT